MGQPRASGGSKPRGGRVGGQMARGHLTPPPALVQAPVQHQAVPRLLPTTWSPDCMDDFSECPAMLSPGLKAP